MERNLLEREIAALNSTRNSLSNFQLANSADAEDKPYRTGKFYGFLTEKSFLRNKDLKTKQTFKGKALYYPNKQLVEILGENANWILVEGGATDEKNGIEQNLKGWIKKSWVKPITSKWLDAFRDATPNRVEYLIDGEKTFRNIAETIRTAKKKGDFIYILGWTVDIKFELIKNDKDSTLQALLTKAANDGVEVRVLIWDNFGGDYSQISPHIKELTKHPTTIKAFVDTATYSTPATIKNIKIVTSTLKVLKTMLGAVPRAALLLTKLDAQINKYLNVGSVGSQHDKVVIVKGESGLSAFCGGIDFNPNRFKDFRKPDKQNQFAGYHDVQCKVESGPEAYQILQKFKLRWQNHPEAGKNEVVELLGDKETPDIYDGNSFRLAKVVGTYNMPNGVIGIPDRSLEYAYRTIIEKSTEYIYIEDQYLVNVDIAKRLNSKIKETNFKKLIIVIQDPLETADMLFPNRMRKAFMTALFENTYTTPAEKGKVAFLMLDSEKAKTKRYHPGLHAKLLIADDEIAIIGTANVNRRSFTHDSETSVVIFDSDDTQPKFAKQLREAIWKEYLTDDFYKSYVGNWEVFASMHLMPNFPSMLSPYRAVTNDLDQRIMSAVNNHKVNLGVILLGGPITTLLSYQAKKELSNKLEASVPLLWDYIIDPEN